MSEWQPIETAPKEEYRSILVCTHSRTRNGYQCDVVYWVDWDERSGWWNGEYRYDPDFFTHWMPLPEPPK